MCGNVVVFVEEKIKESERNRVVVFGDECDRGIAESGWDLFVKEERGW